VIFTSLDNASLVLGRLSSLSKQTDPAATAELVMPERLLQVLVQIRQAFEVVDCRAGAICG
jgi:hypothetical protein